MINNDKFLWGGSISAAQCEGVLGMKMERVLYKLISVILEQLMIEDIFII